MKLKFGSLKGIIKIHSLQSEWSSRKKRRELQIGKIIHQFQVKFLYNVFRIYIEVPLFFVLFWFFICIFTLGSVLCVHVHACRTLVCSVCTFSIYLLISFFFLYMFHCSGTSSSKLYPSPLNCFCTLSKISVWKFRWILHFWV